MAGNFYYVSSVVDTDGLGNIYATDQVGNSFATLSDTNVYGTITQAITAGASDDDDIVFADNHALSTAVALSYLGGTSSALRISCATAADCGIKSTGGSEATTGGTTDADLQKLISVSGVILSSNDTILPSKISGTLIFMHSCRLNLKNSSKTLIINGDGLYLELNDSIIDFYYNSIDILLMAGSEFVMNGGSFASSISGSITNLFYAGFASGGGKARLTQVDLSLISGNLLANVGGSLTLDDTIDVHIDKCDLHASVGFHNETFTGTNNKLLVTQSSSDSAAAEYQYYFHTRGGTVEQATNIWRDESEAYYLSAKKVSLQAIGNSDAEIAIPFTFDFPTRKAALSGVAATDVVRIYLCVINTTTLYDNDVWAELVYPDGTTNNVFNKVNSLATPSDNPKDIFRTKAVLTTDTGSTWKDSGGDLTGYNEYYMDLDTSADAGEDCVPKIVMHVSIELAAGIYFDTSLGVVAS